jgi:hypothetical protein
LHHLLEAYVDPVFEISGRCRIELQRLSGGGKKPLETGARLKTSLKTPKIVEKSGFFRLKTETGDWKP